ncbi:MAG: hypothetical protein HFH69_10160 [Lachnospiraceae bacterium]|nr:hypothetical protein [Lachnospiraceae bacterium]
MRNFKKAMAAVLSAALIAVCAPAPTSSVSYAASDMDYTSAIDLPLNQMQFVTIPAKELKTDDDIWVWYKFHANPNSKIEVTATKLGGGIYLTTQIFDSKFHEIFYESIGNVSKVMQVTDDTTYYLRFKSYFSDEIKVSFMVEGEYDEPTVEPTAAPTIEPTEVPTVQPTDAPVAEPTMIPTKSPTDGSDIGDVGSDFWTDDGNTDSAVYDDELPVPEIIEVSNNSRSVSLEWSCSNTSDIDGYYIYRSEDGKSWNRIATINDTEIEDYEDTDVANGEGYGYIMRSYANESQSENSVPEYTCFLSKVNVKSVKSNASKKLTVKWSINDRASGYQIRFSTTKSFTKTTTETVKVSSKTKSTKTIGRLKGGKKYFVQVRAYRSYNGEIYYSEWSGFKSLKVKR